MSLGLCPTYKLNQFLDPKILSVEEINGQVYGFSVDEIYRIDLIRKSTKKIGDYLNSNIEHFNINQFSHDIINPDIAYFDNKIYIAFESEGSIYYSVYNIDSGIIETSAKLASGDVRGSIPKILVFYNRIFIAWKDGDNDNQYKFKMFNFSGDIILAESSAELPNGDISFLFLKAFDAGNGVHIYTENNTSRNYKQDIPFADNILVGSVVSDADNNANGLKVDENSEKTKLFQFGKWANFDFNGKNYKVVWTEFQGYFVLQGDDNKIVGKFLGEQSPPLIKGGKNVRFDGKPIRRGDTFYFPTLFQGGRHINEGQDEPIRTPMGLGLLKLEIDTEKFVGQVLYYKQTIINSGVPYVKWMIKM